MDSDPGFEALLDFLRESRGFDFGGYKRSSLTRRVARRMAQVRCTGFEDYLDFLQVHPEEYTALFNTILINVTGFLRDSDAWTHLGSDLLPELVAARNPHEQIRVWSAGCASGQEAYSVAMLFAEHLGVEQTRERVKICATDVDEEALAEASAAIFAERDVGPVPGPLRERYFEVQGQRYVFHRDLRRSVVFTAETQARILGRFNLALAEGGLLFLGRSELLLNHGQLFEPIDPRRRFFRKIPREGNAGQK